MICKKAFVAGLYAETFAENLFFVLLNSENLCAPPPSRQKVTLCRLLLFGYTYGSHRI
jgi:hypothetical protein